MDRRNPPSWQRCLAASAVLFVLGGGAKAAVLYDNTGAVPVASDPIEQFGPLADSFSTGASGFNLTDVKVLLQGFGGNGTTTVSLLGDNSTSPGALLATVGTITDASLNVGIATQVDLPLGTAYSLSASTRYWLELSSSNSSSQWYWSVDQNRPGVSGEFFANRRGVEPNSNGPYQMCLADSAGGCAAPFVPMPEPSNVAILGMALIGLGVIQRRRR